MDRLAVLSGVLRLFAEDDPAAARELCVDEYERGGDPFCLGLQSFAEACDTEFATAAATAERARTASADDPHAMLLARGVSGFAAAGWPIDVAFDGPVEDQLAVALAELGAAESPAADVDVVAFIHYLLAEASLASARLDLAQQFVDRAPQLPHPFIVEDGESHPFLVMFYVMRMRLLVFQARITEALALSAQVSAEVSAAKGFPLLGQVLEATRCLAFGNADQRPSAKPIADRLEKSLPDPASYLSSGCYLLVAFGLVATADVPRAAHFVLLAGGNAGLDRLTIIDRALGLELLVAAAVADGDVDAAEAWRAQAEPLLRHPIAVPAVHRLISRVELLAGRAESATSWAASAVQTAHADGRIVEATESEIVLSRARIALAQTGAASVALESMATKAVGSGHLAARKSAARELRGIGRRLRPLAGSGWDGLSAREREVALLIAEGSSNRAIAEALFLSQHTVQVHVSRVLAAFGVASRAAAAAKLMEMVPQDSGLAPLAPLTTRQQAVVECIVLGRTNEQIGRDLGVSVKTVEKHIREILQRWGLASRTGIIRYAGRADSSASPEQRP